MSLVASFLDQQSAQLNKVKERNLYACAGFILENKGMRAVLTKKGQESPVKGHNCGFLLLIFPKRHVF